MTIFFFPNCSRVGVCVFLTVQDTEPSQSPQDPVGRPIMHLAGINHATGEAVYVDDLPSMDGELFLAVVTSTRAHARIV